MKAILFYSVVSIAMLMGLILTSKEAGWPSEAERKNRAIRSVKGGAGATAFCIGLILLILFRTSSGHFLDTWSLLPTLGFLFFFVMPLFVLMVIGSYIQYSVLEKSQSLKIQRLRKIIETKSKHSNKS